MKKLKILEQYKTRQAEEIVKYLHKIFDIRRHFKIL